MRDGAGGVVLDLAYGRDAAGRIGAVDSLYPVGQNVYVYDDLDELIRHVDRATTGDYSFAYDAAHNFISNSALGAYVYGPANGGLLPPHAPIQVGQQHFAYDANGNRTARTLPGFAEYIVWDADNRRKHPERTLSVPESTVSAGQAA